MEVCKHSGGKWLSGEQLFAKTHSENSPSLSIHFEAERKYHISDCVQGYDIDDDDVIVDHDDV